MQVVPPCTAARSSSSTRAPPRAASSAAHPPAIPNPATTTSYRSVPPSTTDTGKRSGITERGRLPLPLSAPDPAGQAIQVGLDRLGRCVRQSPQELGHARRLPPGVVIRGGPRGDEHADVRRTGPVRGAPRLPQG